MITIYKLQEIVSGASALMNVAFDVKSKGGYENIVTSADVNVQNFLRQRLSEELPGSGFLCEEEDRHDLNHEYVWIIDPIDGTANFARGIDQCAICVGLKDRAGMLMSGVYLPRTDEMFTAERGKGAYRNGEPIHVSGRPFANGILCTALPVYHKEHAPECAAAILDVFNQCNDLRRFGAAAPELCYLAMGRVDLYFEYLLSPWDFAAASLILQEAGGIITTLKGQPTDPLSPSGILAANTRKNLQRLLTIIHKHLPAYND
ncbi:MAG: inositol monophosphatase [Bacteroidales bacterium]|nr:inositol monophosphatase [Bacteroidales bacterium]MCD8393840.1 inositol monophosphatase [Bacteroidales bacterium]